MTKRHVDIDDDELRLAQAASGYSSVKDTVSAGLRELVAADARRREIESLTSGGMAEFADKEFRAEAWRQPPSTG